MSYRHSDFYMADASVLEQGAAEATATFDELYHKELYRCAKDAYVYIATTTNLIDYYACTVSEVDMNTTGVVENMFREHSRDMCSCDYRVFVARGPNCWIDGDFLTGNRPYSYNTKVEESVVSEVVELSSECYRFSEHPITFEPRECSANGGSCNCNLKITRLTISYLINDLFVLRYPAMRSQCYILAGGEHIIRDGVSGTIIEHYNDRPIAQQYRRRLLHTFIPLFQKRLFDNIDQWCPDDIYSSGSENDDDNESNNNASTSTV